MRRKNLYVTEVDVYLAGLYLSTEALLMAKNWKKSQSADVLSDVVIRPDRAGKNPDEATAAVTLRFVRGVSKTQVVDAFNDAFKGCDKEAVEDFRAALAGALPDAGLKVGQEFTFVWAKNGHLKVLKEAYVSKSVTSTEVSKRLLDVYVNPAKTVSKELVESTKENLDKVA
jgi:Chalcone isomerase-like